jgi:hypothetical protein
LNFEAGQSKVGNISFRPRQQQQQQEEDPPSGDPHAMLRSFNFVVFKRRVMAFLVSNFFITIRLQDCKFATSIKSFSWCRFTTDVPDERWRYPFK